MKTKIVIGIVIACACGCVRQAKFAWPDVNSVALLQEASKLCSNAVPHEPDGVQKEDWTPVVRSLDPIEVIRDEHVVIIALATGAQHRAILVAPDRRETWGPEEPEVQIERIAPGVFRGTY